MNEPIILLVEDEPGDVRLTERALKSAKLVNRLIVAHDGQEALDYLFGAGPYAARDVREMPVLVLLDLKLPKIDGLEVLRRIREGKHTHYLPVVILTSSREEQDVLAGYGLGANSYIRKPVDFEQFVAAAAQLGIYWLVLNEPPPMLRG
jgi:two-component system response regulator